VNALAPTRWAASPDTFGRLLFIVHNLFKLIRHKYDGEKEVTDFFGGSPVSPS
jgi:hypothetical protein